MLNNFISREFDDATFVFDPQSLNSLFIEGTVADLVLAFLKDSNIKITKKYFSKIPLVFQAQAKKEAELVRKNVQSFLSKIGSKEYPTSGSIPPAENIESPMQRLLAYAIKKWQIVNVSIEVTHNCNLHCQCCYVGNFTKQGLQRHELQKIAEQLRKNGAIFILFTGGEIFLRRDILEVMSDFDHLGFALEVKSNGMLLNQSTITKLANLNLFSLQISVYDIEDRHSAFTGDYYQFSRLANNIQIAIEQRIPLSLAVLVGKHNVNDLDRHHDALQKLGVKEIFYNPYITPQRNGSGKEKTFRLSKKEMEEKFYPFIEKIDGFVNLRKYRDRCKNNQDCSL